MRGFDFATEAMMPMPSSASAAMAIQIVGMCSMCAAIASAAIRMTQPRKERLNQFTAYLRCGTQQWRCLTVRKNKRAGEIRRLSVRCVRDCCYCELTILSTAASAVSTVSLLLSAIDFASLQLPSE